MKQVFSMVVLCALLLTSFAARAQDGELEMAEYSTEDGSFSAAYPADWVTAEVMILPFPSVWYAPEAEMIDGFISSGAPAEGEVIGLSFIAPTQLIAAFGFGIPADAPVTEMASLFGMLLGEPPVEEGGEEGAPVEGESAEDEASAEGEDEGMGFEMPPLPEAEEVTIGEDVTAGYVEQSNGVYDQVLYVTRIADDLLAVSALLAPVGELADEHKAIAEAAVLSLSSPHGGEEILDVLVMSMLLPDEEDVTADALDGAALAQERCTVCHGAEWWDPQDKTDEEWEATVDRMVLHGAQLTAAEREAIIDYLAETH